MKNILFVCTYNLQRSPTAEDIINNSPYHNTKYNAKSAGISSIAKVKITKQSIEWSDMIFVMEHIHKEFLLKNFPGAKKKIIVLDIPDMYLRNDPYLINLLKEKLKRYL
ncbi:phosphotyrosine protein phosphatase [Candidatus Pacearchaeota archaeon]|nr:phosphotyrosine protein phosphatase [Candidatus Pacearchaeota archaeon]